ncbi:MAG: nucleotidyl transferase AbiEii/AbiGii toxin family protein [Pseudomonadota bacterium]
MKKEIKDHAASVRAKLLNYSKQHGIIFNRILIYYFQERFLYRVSISKYKNDLILKGGALLLSLNIAKSRPTQDIDFLLKRENLDHETAKRMIKAICEIPVEDGVIFLSETISSMNIREDNLINSLRVKFNASLGSARSKMQIDIGFKDSVKPKPIVFNYPTILDLKAPKIVAYSWETVVAEKFEAMVKLYLFNSRLKDFYDILYLSQNVSFNSIKLKEAMSATFKKRKLNIEDAMSLFEDVFTSDGNKQIQWKAFLRKSKLESDDSFLNVMKKIKQFLLPIVESLIIKSLFNKTWEVKNQDWI